MPTPSKPFVAFVARRRRLSGPSGARALMSFSLTLAAMALATAAVAADTAGSVAAAPAAGSAPAASVRPGASGEPKVERIVTEDSGSRIEELRVRGQTRSIHVKPKGAIGAGYEVVPADPGRDSAAGPSNGKSLAGQRVWSVWSF